MDRSIRTRHRRPVSRCALCFCGAGEHCGDTIVKPGKRVVTIGHPAASFCKNALLIYGFCREGYGSLFFTGGWFSPELIRDTLPDGVAGVYRLDDHIERVDIGNLVRKPSHRTPWAV